MDISGNFFVHLLFRIVSFIDKETESLWVGKLNTWAEQLIDIGTKCNSLTQQFKNSKIQAHRCFELVFCIRSQQEIFWEIPGTQRWKAERNTPRQGTANIVTLRVASLTLTTLEWQPRCWSTNMSVSCTFATPTCKLYRPISIVEMAEIKIYMIILFILSILFEEYLFLSQNKDYDWCYWTMVCS